MIEWMHPSLPLMIAALITPFFGVWGRRILGIVAPVLSFFVLLLLPAGYQQVIDLMGFHLVTLKVDALTQVFAYAFTIYGIVSGIYSWNDLSRGSKSASLLLVSGGVGVVCAGDLLVLFLFWEWLTIASLFLIWGGGTQASRRAGFRYMLLHLAGAVCLLAGILLQASQNGGSFAIDVVAPGPAMVLMAIGLLTNAAVPPLHAWLPDSYPEASVFGSVYLSAFTTKAAVYVLLRTLPGTEALAWLGAGMALYGVVFAVLENNIRRLLVYHIVSQVGYMVAGVGLGTALAINGTGAHAFSHIFYKGLLMMSAGTVIYVTGCQKLTELGGLSRSMKWTFLFCMIGAFSISGVPLFNGFISKSIIISAAAMTNQPVIELMLIVASMGTFLHTGLKLPWFMFVDRPKIAKVERPVPISMYIAMGVAAAVCIITGIFPDLLYNLLPHVMDYHPYTADHVIQALQLLIGTALGFWILRPYLGGEATLTLDVDRLYRRPLAFAAESVGSGFIMLGERVRQFNSEWIAAGNRALIDCKSRLDNAFLSNHVAIILSAFVILGIAMLFR